MKKLISITFLILSFVSCKNKAVVKNSSDKVKDFQYKMNIEFADKKTSPLTDVDFKAFSSLSFYPINKEFQVNAEFKRTANEKPFKMLTTTSRIVDYVKFGEAHFNLNGKEVVLNIYQNLALVKKPEYQDYLFLPFTDLTNANETYAGGRYIDLRTPKDNYIIIDFNQAYNPYCAYNHKYSCPIPPSENHLDIEVKAGVLKFH